jgi:hypothetical protein
VDQKTVAELYSKRDVCVFVCVCVCVCVCEGNDVNYTM